MPIIGGSGGPNPNWPLLSLAFGLGQPPNQLAPSYPLNVAWKNRKLQTTRGRQYELAQAQAGTLTGNLDNSDGQFSPLSGLNLNLVTEDIASPGCVSGSTAAFSTLVGGTTLAIDTTQKLPLGPPSSLQVNIPTGVVSSVVVAASQKFLVSPSTVYSIAAQINAGLFGADLTISWYTQAGTLISTNFGSTVAAGTTGWSTHANLTSPSNAMFATFGITPGSGTTSSVSTHFIGNFCLALGGTVVEETVAVNYPNIKVETPVQLQASFAGVTYPPLWTGFVERWPQTWNSPAFGVNNFVAVDALSTLSNITLDAAYDAEVLIDDPLAYYPLHEAAGSTVFANASANSQPNGFVVLSPIAPAPPVFGSTTLQAPLGDAGTSVTGASTVADGYQNGGYLRATAGGVGPVLTPVGGVCVEAMIRQGSDLWVPIIEQSGASGTSIAVAIGTLVAVGNLEAVNVYLDGFFYLASPVGSVTENSDHHIAVVLAADQKTMTIYIDGVAAASSVAGSPIVFSSGTSSTVNIGAMLTVFQVTLTSPNGILPTSGQLSNVALYNAPLSSTRIASHANVALTAAANETTGARHQRILTYAGWKGPSTNFECVSVAGPLKCAGSAVTDALQLNALSEAGTMYIDGPGNVTLAGRQYRESLLPAGFGNPNQTKAMWVCGDAPDASEYHYDSAPIFDYDPTYIYNDVENTNYDGVIAAAVDTTSLLAYFPRTLTQTVNLASDQDNTDQAGWLRSRYKQPAIRSETITFSPSNDPNLWPFVLGAEIGDLITINRRPNGAPMVSVVGFVEQIAHNLQPGAGDPSWQTSITVSPLFTYYGRVTALHSTLNAAVAATATSMVLTPLLDSALNAAETAIVPAAPAGVAQLTGPWTGNASVLAATPGTRLTIDPGGANPETVTVTSVTSQPTARTAGYTTIAVSFTPPLGFAHASGALVCEFLPAPHTAPTDWDQFAIVDDGTATIGDLLVSY